MHAEFLRTVCGLQWKRQYGAFASSTPGQIIGFALFFYVCYSGLIWRLLNVFFLLWWVMVLLGWPILNQLSRKVSRASYPPVCNVRCCASSHPKAPRHYCVSHFHVFLPRTCALCSPKTIRGGPIAIYCFQHTRMHDCKKSCHQHMLRRLREPREYKSRLEPHSDAQIRQLRKPKRVNSGLTPH